MEFYTSSPSSKSEIKIKTFQKNHPMCLLVSPNRRVCSHHTVPVLPPWTTWEAALNLSPTLNHGMYLQKSIACPPLLPNLMQEPLAGEL